MFILKFPSKYYILALGKSRNLKEPNLDFKKADMFGQQSLIHIYKFN